MVSVILVSSYLAKPLWAIMASLFYNHYFYQYSQHELMNSKVQRKGLVTWLWRHAACRLQLLTQQINAAAPSCFITPCNISNRCAVKSDPL